MRDKAIFVVNTKDTMSQASRDSITHAAGRWEADFVEITKFDGKFHPAALKLKAFELCDYDNLFILDADTIIRNDAPSIFAQAPAEFFCAVRNNQPHTPKVYRDANTRLAKEQIEAIIETKSIEEPIDVDWLSENFFNSGVVVASRREHALVLAYAFHLFSNVPNINWWDQIPLNIAVHILLGGYTDIGSTWNFMFPNRLDQMNAFIYHLAGNPNRYHILNGNINWRTQ